EGNHKLTLFYLCNDVVQNSKKKGTEFTDAFQPVSNVMNWASLCMGFDTDVAVVMAPLYAYKVSRVSPKEYCK
ncbi:hypothetical protein EV182_007706, partial [Spiromyces aspiralis]